MKQKYTITVADMELNIISDAAPDEVENIVGMLDRRMRDINLKSPRCTKNEAAVLCALAYCSERIAMQEAFKKVEKDAFRFAAENEKQKKTVEKMQEEIDRLKQDNDLLRSLLERSAAAAPAPVAPTPAPASQQAEEKPAEAAPVAPAAPVVSAVAASSVEAPVAPTAPVPPANAEPTAAEAVAPTPKKNDKPSGKKSFPPMFDHLFHDNSNNI